MLIDFNLIENPEEYRQLLNEAQIRPHHSHHTMRSLPTNEFEDGAGRSHVLVALLRRQVARCTERGRL
jgi:hypothetical protein